MSRISYTNTYHFWYLCGMVTTRILSSSEARKDLPAIGKQIEAEGLDFKPVLFGTHRKPVGAIVPVELLDRMEGLLEDAYIARTVAPRLTAGEGDASMAEIAAGLGLDPARFE